MNQDQQKTKWTTFQKVILFALCAPLVLFVVIQVRNSSISKNPVAVAELISKRSNEQCPRMVDANTQLDSTSSQGQTFINNYTVLNIDSQHFDLAANLAPMRSRLIENYKTNPALAELRKLDIQIVHIYKDKQGLPLMTIGVSPHDF